MPDDRLTMQLTVSRELLEDCAYNYASARYVRGLLHEELDKRFDDALEEMRVEDEEHERLGDPDPRY